MKFASVISVIATSSVVLALRGRPEDRQTRRRSVTEPWAGAAQQGQGWNFVTGTITVPDVSGQDANRAVAIWVGIDGWSCQNAIWQTGLTFYGDGSIDNWFEWWPREPERYTQTFNVKPGDQVRMTVHAWSKTSGNSTLENLTTGQKTYKEVRNMQQSLCMTDADWIFEDFGQVNLADFGTASFANTTAVGSGGSATPDGAWITEIESNGISRTSCSSDKSGVQCSYIS